MMNDVMLKRFENPDAVRTFDKGKFEVVAGSATAAMDDGANHDPGKNRLR